MAICYVTTLKEAVTNTALPKVNELIIPLTKVDDDNVINSFHHIRLVSSTNQTIFLEGDCHFTDSSLATDKGTTLTLRANIAEDFYISNHNGELHIPDKTAIRYLFTYETTGESDDRNIGYPFTNIEAKYFEGMSSLQQLSLARNAYGDIKYLKDNDCLVYATFTDSPISGDIKYLSKASTLLGITLNGSSVTGDLSVATNWPNLVTFNALRTNITGSIASFAGLNSLTTLNVDSNLDVSGNISALNNKPKLQLISFNNTKVTGDIGQLANDTTLKQIFWSFSSTPSAVTGSISSLAGLVNLTTLTLPANSAITGSVANVIREMPNLVSLTLSNIQGVTGDILTELHYCPSIASVLLENCGNLIGDLEQLANNTNLVTFTAPNTGLSGNISNLSNCSKLTSLNLQGCSEVEGTLAAFANNTSLSSLNLGFTQVTGSVESLAGCTNLKSFYAFALNNLTGNLAVMPDGFCLFQNTYGISSLSWTTVNGNSSKKTFSIQGVNFGSYLSAMLIDMGARQDNPNDLTKSISVSGTRANTAAESTAIKNLRKKGYLITINSVATYN